MRTRAFFLFASLSTAYAADVHGGDWPNWRGPNHDGISQETDVNLVWKGRPKLLWERELGSSFSAVAAVGDRAYTCGTQKGQQVLLCLEADTGKVVWARPIEKELREGQGGDGTRATPAIDDGRVYIFGARGTLLCADARTGKPVWRKQFKSKPTWAYSGSVLIEGNLAIISPGGKDGGLLALNKKNGKPVWNAGNDGAGYATPYPFTFKGRRFIVGFVARRAIIVDAKKGRLHWSTSWKTSHDVNAATPIFHDGHLFLSSGYGTGCALYRLGVSGSQLNADKIWQNRVLRSKFQTCVLYNGKLYGADEQGLKCVDFKTGEEEWNERRIEGSSTKHGTVVVVKDHLVFFSQSGQLQVSKASPAGFESLASARPVSGRCWTVPTLADGRLYVRDLEKLVCLDLRK